MNQQPPVRLGNTDFDYNPRNFTGQIPPNQPVNNGATNPNLNHQFPNPQAFQNGAGVHSFNPQFGPFNNNQPTNLNPYNRHYNQSNQTTKPVDTSRQASEINDLEEGENYYTNTTIIGFIAISFYLIGASILIFTRNIGNEAVVVLPGYEISWKLLFTNFGAFFQNSLLNIFGYFVQYAKLFGYFENIGSLTIEPREKYLMPVDIIIKGLTIFYFHFRWMKWDTGRMFLRGMFNKKYPYVDKSQPEIAKIETVDADLSEEFYLASGKEFSAAGAADKQIYPNQERLVPVDFKNRYASNYYQNNTRLASDDDEDEYDDEQLIPFFDGVHKPLEEWYYKHEEAIYGFIRTRLLPGTNLVLALYFSTLTVLDLARPWEILLYLLGVMSLFWCMQSFLLILDHNQYRPEEE